jgi:hypothetical protein
MLRNLETILGHLDTIVVLGSFVTYIIIQALKLRKRKSGIDFNSEVDKRIYKLLWPILVKFRTSRLFIFQFHNGDNFYTGQSIQRKTMSHEIVADENLVPLIKKNFDNVLVSELMHDLITILKSEQLFGIDSFAHPTDKLSTRMFNLLIRQSQVYEFRSMYMFRIVNKKGQTVAILGMHWKHVQPLNDNDKAYLLEYKRQFESVFNTL